MKTSKKVLSVLLAVLLLATTLAVAAVPVSALDASGSCGTNLTYTFNASTGALTITGTGSLLQHKAFKDCTEIKSVSICSSVTEIGFSAFCGCSSLTSVTIPYGVKIIDSCAFSRCTSLTSLTLPNSVEGIYQQAFEKCTSLKSVTIPDSIKEISPCVFEHCTALESVTFPDSVKRIEWDAFYDCPSLKTLTFNGSPRIIDESAFDQCDAVEELAILSGEDVHSALVCQFPNLKNLTIGTTRVGHFGTDEYGQTTLKGLPALQHLTFLDTVEDIKSFAFSDCPKLETVQFGNSRTYFGSGSFDNCKKLKKLIAPTDAINADMSFFNCGDYMVYCKNSMQPYSFHRAANYRYVPEDARFVSVKIVGSPPEWGTVRGGEHTGGPVQLYTNYQNDYCVSGYSRITVKATPKTGYFFKGWYSYKNLGRVSRDTEYTFVANEDTSLFARFEDSDFYTVTTVANPDEGGTITGAGNYAEGDTVTLTVTPNIFWKFLGWWSIRGQKVSSDPSYTFTCTGSTTYTAKFEYTIERYRLTLDSNDGGCPSWWGTRTYALNEEATITAEPDDGYRFVGWFKNNSLFSSNETLTLQLTEDVSLYAKFEKIPIYSVQTTVSPTAGGTVSGGGSFLENTKATVSAQEKPGYDFVGWFKNNSKVSFSHNYTFTVTGNVTLTAKFRTLENYTVTLNISPANGGTVSGGGVYQEGTRATITATPNDNYVFVGWYYGDDFWWFSNNIDFRVGKNTTLTARFYDISQFVDVKIGTEDLKSGDWYLDQDAYIEALLEFGLDSATAKSNYAAINDLVDRYAYNPQTKEIYLKSSDSSSLHTSDDSFYPLLGGTSIKQYTAPTNPDNPGQPDNPGGSQPQGKVCKYCGGTHTGFLGFFVGLFHSILALFGLRKK